LSDTTTINIFDQINVGELIRDVRKKKRKSREVKEEKRTR